MQWGVFYRVGCPPLYSLSLHDVGQKKQNTNTVKIVNTASAPSVNVKSAKTINRTFAAIASGAALALAGVSTASAQITNATVTQMEGTFTQIQDLGEAASIVAGTLAIISVAVSFIWRARG